MKILRKLRLALVAGSMAMLSAPASANWLTFQDVLFGINTVGGDTFLTINGISGATGNWSGVNYISAFEIKNIGDVTSASIDNAGWLATVSNGLAAGVGCGTGGTPGGCFYAPTPMAVNDAMSFTLHFFGTNLNFDAPHLKVQFLTNINDTMATGSLLSQTVPIPEPEIYAMLAFGLGVVGWAARRKKA